MIALFASCAGQEERKPIVTVAARGGSGGKGGSATKSGSATKGGAGGTSGSHASADGGSGEMQVDPGGSGGADGLGAGATSGDAGAGGSGARASGIADDCSTDADCPQGHCITLSVGFRTCQTPPVEATQCSPNPSQDDCCDTSDCATGLTCFPTSAFHFSNQPEFNVCTSDACTTDADCLNDEVCVPKGALGQPVAFCISAVCHSDADCTEYGPGRCTPMINECDGSYWALACAYAGPGACKTNADCSNDMPPFGPGERYCHLGSCSDVIAGTVCD